MPLPILGGIVLVALIGASAIGISVVSAASTAIDRKAKKKLKSRPTGIPRPPHGRGMTRAELKRAAQEKLNMDVTRYFNFAFCGACGAGKSSLLNALRNLDDVDFVEGKAHNIYGSAPTGEWQTTNVTRDYAYPVGHELQHVRLWDLAGCGTNEHPSANYFDEKVLYAFDVLILVTAHELGEYEYGVLENAEKQKIPVVIAITKVDVKVDSKIRKLYNTRNPPIKAYRQIVQETIEEARQRVSVCLQNRGLPNTLIFVVSAWKYRDFMMDREALMNSQHQEIHSNQIVDTDESVGQEVSDDEVDSSILRDDEAQRQEIARDECREKNAIISFELHELLSYIADCAIDRRL